MTQAQYDYDGRPTVDDWDHDGCDRLLELLIKHHPELAIKLRLKNKLDRRVNILATAE